MLGGAFWFFIWPPKISDASIQWANSEIISIGSLQDSLEQYKTKHGEYPDTLNVLTPEYITTIPTPSEHNKVESGNSWHYKRIGEHYQLWASVNHWVSTFDVLVYRTDSDYGFADNVSRTRAIGDWLYVAGGSDLELQ